MILEVRDKPIITMLEWIRVRLMIRMYVRGLRLKNSLVTYV